MEQFDARAANSLQDTLFRGRSCARFRRNFIGRTRTLLMRARLAALASIVARPEAHVRPIHLSPLGKKGPRKKLAFIGRPPLLRQLYIAPTIKHPAVPAAVSSPLNTIIRGTGRSWMSVEAGPSGDNTKRCNGFGRMFSASTAWKGFILNICFVLAQRDTDSSSYSRFSIYKFPRENRDRTESNFRRGDYCWTCSVGRCGR